MQEEPVELRLGQGEGALMLDGVLGRHHHEGIGQRARHTARRDLRLAHRLKQRGLHLGRRAVDLVHQHQFVEDRAWLEVEAPAVGAEDLRADDVRGHQVRRALYPGEAARQPRGQPLDRPGLGQPRRPLDQHMPSGQKGDHQPLHQHLMSDQPGCDLRGKRYDRPERPGPFPCPVGCHLDPPRSKHVGGRVAGFARRGQKIGVTLSDDGMPACRGHGDLWQSPGAVSYSAISGETGIPSMTGGAQSLPGSDRKNTGRRVTLNLLSPLFHGPAEGCGPQIGICPGSSGEGHRLRYSLRFPLNRPRPQSTRPAPDPLMAGAGLIRVSR